MASESKFNVDVSQIEKALGQVGKTAVGVVDSALEGITQKAAEAIKDLLDKRQELRDVIKEAPKGEAGYAQKVVARTRLKTIRQNIEQEVRAHDSGGKILSRERARLFKEEQKEEANRLRTENMKHSLEYASIKKHAREKADVEKKEKKKTRDAKRVDMQEDLRSALLFQSAVSAITSPLPGGHMVQSAMYGWSSGKSRARQEAERLGHGKARTALSGIMGGLAGGATMLGVTALASGMAAGVQGSQENENWIRTLGRSAGGNVGVARAAKGAAASSTLTQEEMVPIMAQMVSATRGVGGGFSSANRAQTIAGAGGEFAGLMGAVTRGGGFAGKKSNQIDETAKRTWINIFSSGLVQGFKGGNVSEMIAGATAAANDRVLGGVVKGEIASEFSSLAASLYKASGGSAAFLGTEMTSLADRMVKGEGSPLALGVGLVSAGLGEGKSLVQAQMDREAGIFGSRTDETDDPRSKIGPGARLRKYLNEVGSMFGTGGDKESVETRALGIQQMHPGMSTTAAYRMASLDPSSITDKTALELQEASKTKGEKKEDKEMAAYDAMISLGSNKGLEKSMQLLRQALGTLLNDTGGIAALTKAVIAVTGPIQWLAKRFAPETPGEKKTGAITKGDISALRDANISADTDPALAAEYVKQRQEALGRGVNILSDEDYDYWKNKGLTDEELATGDTGTFAGPGRSTSESNILKQAKSKLRMRKLLAEETTTKIYEAGPEGSDTKKSNDTSKKKSKPSQPSAGAS